MRKLCLLILLLFLLPIVFSIENCKTPIEPTDIPCRVISAWNYTPPCSSYNATVYNKTGYNIENYSFADYGTTGLCFFTFNISTSGSYSFSTGNGDYGKIMVVYENMILGIIIAIGIVIALFMFLAFKLDDTHWMLRLGFIFFSVALISFIPSIFLINDFALIFHKLMMRIVTFFWLYTGVYIFYWLYQQFIKIISKNEKE